MSVSKVKKRFAEFESFLGKDKEGLRRLKLLKDDVNELRVSLAAAQRTAAEAVERQQALKHLADVSAAEADRLSVENHTVKQQLASVLRELNRHLTNSTKEDVGGVESQGESIELFNEGGMKATIKELRKHQRFCPRLLRNFDIDGENAMAFDRDALASGWGHTAIWTLGAAVAILSMYSGKVVVCNSTTVKKVRSESPSESPPGWMRHFIQWFCENNVDRGNRADVLAFDAMDAVTPF